MEESAGRYYRSEDQLSVVRTLFAGLLALYACVFTILLHRELIAVLVLVAVFALLLSICYWIAARQLTHTGYTLLTDSILIHHKKGNSDLIPLSSIMMTQCVRNGVQLRFRVKGRLRRLWLTPQTPAEAKELQGEIERIMSSIGYATQNDLRAC